MKKLLLLFTLAVLTTEFVTAADKVGFQDSTAKISVAQALKMTDNSYATIEGNIIKRLSDDKYLFKDSTGTITVEIDNDKWAGQSVNITDKLELTGEIEKKFNTIKMDVDTVKTVTK